MKDLLKIAFVFLIFIYLKVDICNAQINVSEVISSGGIEPSNENYSNFGVLGETFVNNSVSNDYYETSMGFLNSFMIKTFAYEIKQEFSFKIFPNPTHQHINIEFSIVPQKYNLELYNNMGQRILQYERNNKCEQINLKGFTSGIYYLKIFNREFLKTEKIIVK